MLIRRLSQERISSSTAPLFSSISEHKFLLFALPPFQQNVFLVEQSFQGTQTLCIKFGGKASTVQLFLETYHVFNFFSLISLTRSWKLVFLSRTFASLGSNENVKFTIINCLLVQNQRMISSRWVIVTLLFGRMPLLQRHPKIPSHNDIQDFPIF